MASLRSLPPEIFCCVAEILADAGCDGSLAALTATCRGFHELATPYLFRHVADRHPLLLYWAVRFNYVATVRRLLEASAPVDLAWVTTAIWTGESKTAREVSLGAQTSPRDRYREFQHLAELSSIKLVPREKLEVESKMCDSFWFPIHLAAMNGSVEMVKVLVEQTPELMTAPSFHLCWCQASDLTANIAQRQHDVYDHHLPLHLAICCGHNDVARWLLQHGCSPRATINLARSRELGVGFGDSDLESTPKINEAVETDRVPHYATVLHEATRFGRLDILRFILNGACQTDVQVIDSRQFTPVWHAYLGRQWGALDLLLAQGADVDDDLGYGYTPLMDACLCNRFECAAKLTDRGANVNVAFFAGPRLLFAGQNYPDPGSRPIDIVCRRQIQNPDQHLDLDLVVGDLSRAWEPDPSGTGWSEWSDYKEQGDSQLIFASKLLAAGADLDPSQAFPGHSPPLVWAAANHHSALVKELIKHGAPVNLPDKDGVSALAAVFGYELGTSCPLHPEILYDAISSSFSQRLRTVRIYSRDPDCSQGGCPELRACVDLLLQGGANATQPDADGTTPLARLIRTDCIRSKCAGDRPDFERASLVWCTPADKAHLTRLLLTHGANPRAEIKPTGDPNVVRDWRSLRGPVSLMEHAFWEASFEACLALFEGGADPDVSSVRWMIQLVISEGRKPENPTSQAALQVITSLPTELQRRARQSPACLALALRRGWFAFAREIWDAGLELCQFAEKAHIRCDNSAEEIDGYGEMDEPVDADVEWGQICLQEALRPTSTMVHKNVFELPKFIVTPIVEGLLELGVRTIPIKALAVAVEEQNHQVTESLLRHGATIHIVDEETDVNLMRVGHLEPRCINPLKWAIKYSEHKSIKLMLEWSPSIDPWFRFYYLKEAFTVLKPATVQALLAHPNMHFGEADITDKADLPLAYLVRHGERICSLSIGYYGFVSRVERISLWILCIAVFAQAGVDPGMRDRAGKSTLKYLGEHITYRGKDRFRQRLASELRAIGEAKVDGQLSPESLWQALKSLEIPQRPQ